jgi:hypothetical protein
MIPAETRAVAASHRLAVLTQLAATDEAEHPINSGVLDGPEVFGERFSRSGDG